MKSKKASETLAVTTHVVLPNDTNPLGNLFGGQLLAWMDIVASISAQRHCRRVVVTASVNNVSFQEPIPSSAIVTLESKVSRAFSSSMEVFVDVFIEDQVSGAKRKCNEAIYTFVAVDQLGGPIQVPELVPETLTEPAGVLEVKTLVNAVEPPMPPPVPETTLSALLFCVVTCVHPVGAAA